MDTNLHHSARNHLLLQNQNSGPYYSPGMRPPTIMFGLGPLQFYGQQNSGKTEHNSGGGRPLLF